MFLSVLSLLYLMCLRKLKWFIIPFVFFIGYYVYHNPVISPDYENYTDSINSGNTFRWDPLYKAVHYIAIQTKDVNLMYSINTIIILLILSIISLKSRLGFKASIISIIMPKSFIWSFWLPRQYLGIYLFFLFLIYSRSVIGVISSFFIHNSFVGLLPIVLLKELKIKKLVKFTVFGGLFFWLILKIQPLLYQSIALKILSTEYLDSSGKSWLILLLIISTFLSMIKRTRKDGFTLFGIILIMLYLNSFFAGIILRFSYFLLPYFWITIARLDNKKDRFVYYIILFILAVINIITFESINLSN